MRVGDLGFAALLLCGCAAPPPPDPFVVNVKVETEVGRPLAGATILRENKPVAATKADGRAMLKLTGVEGEIVDLVVACPAGYVAPPRPLSIRLTRPADKTKVLEFPVQCASSLRRVVVAVRAENGPNLPVIYLDREAAHTDASGAATFVLEAPPGAQFNVALDTSSRKDLKPVNPTKLFVVSTQDDVLLFDQKFEVDKKVVPHR